MGEAVHLLVATIFHDAAATLTAAVDSVLGQVGADDFEVTLLLVDDGSTDDWRARLGTRLDAAAVHARSVELRSVASTRNFVLDEVERAFPCADYVCRLDADDVLAGPGVLGEVASALRRERPDALIASNLQDHEGVVSPAPNVAVADLLDPDYLLDRLRRMATGDPSAELPSCNTVVRRGLGLRYPEVPSAEDHWFTVSLLLEPRLSILPAPELVYAVYRLYGERTRQNEACGAYLRSRRELLRFAQARIRERA